MNETKEKTALNASVGADAGQSIQSKTTEIITAESPEINDLEDISQEKFFQQMQRMADMFACRHHVNQLVGNILRMAGHKADGKIAVYLADILEQVGKSISVAVYPVAAV